MPSGDQIITLTDQVMPGPAQFNFPGGFTFTYSAVPLADNPRFDVHPDSRPSDLFAVKSNRCSIPDYRFIRKGNPSQMLMFVDGACMGNGTADARAGWAVCFGPQIVVKGRLEPEGGPQTNNRAELRAALVALGLRVWSGEGFSTIVLATDSEYVVKGYCENLPKWKQRGWKTSEGRPVMNRELWEALDEKIRAVAKYGSQVQFWWIPRKLNEADKYAKEAANLPPTQGSPNTQVIFMPRY